MCWDIIKYIFKKGFYSYLYKNKVRKDNSKDIMVSLSTDREIIYTITDYILIFTHRLKTVPYALFLSHTRHNNTWQNGDKEKQLSFLQFL